MAYIGYVQSRIDAIAGSFEFHREGEDGRREVIIWSI